MTARRPLGVAALLSLLASLLALAPAAPAVAQATDLIITGVVDGPLPGGFPKAVELYAVNDVPDLSTYSVRNYNNGSSSATSTTSLSGSLAAGEFLHVSDETDGFTEFFGFAPDVDANFQVNGDDVVTLEDSDGVIDSLGVIGVDGTGEDWEYTDGWAYRTDGTGPEATFDSTDWSFSGTNALDGETTNATAAVPFPIGSYAASTGPQATVINEFSASTTGTDVEYIELLGAPSTDYTDHVVVQVEGDSASDEGQIKSITPMGTTDGDGRFLVELTSNTLENGTATLLLVEGFTGAAGDDLDTDDDGSLDSTPWSDLLDDVAVHDGGTDDRTYATTVLEAEYDGLSFAPGGASRIPDGVDTDTAEDWVRNDFDLAGIEGEPGTPEPGEAYNTPGEPNEVVPEDDGGGEPLDGTPALIHEVQGSGEEAALLDETVEVTGIVTSLFEADDALDAFFLQEEDGDADEDPQTSEGIFVFCRGFCPAELAVGDQVTVDGVVDEYFGMTQLEPGSAADIAITSSDNDLPTAVELTLPAEGSTTAEATYEAVEGMVVTYTDTLAVSEIYEYARYGQIVLADGSRPYQFTHTDAPDEAGYDAYLDQLATTRIILDDANNTQNDSVVGPESDEPLPYPSSSWPDGGLSTSNYFRGGDTITGLTGVMHWSFAGRSGTDAWRVRPIDGEDYTFEPANPRTAAPADTGGSLTVAAFNVLNYFPTPDTGPDVCGPTGEDDCRGASSEAEFERQQDKIVAALAAMDADVVGLIEIENDATAVQDLVDALNAQVGAGTYAQIDTGSIGTDAIKVGFIYQPGTVEPVGAYDILDESDDDRFDDDRNRPMLTQSFREIATGEVFTAAVNHLKSKGSGCGAGDDAPETGAGNCDATRASAAAAIVDYLADDPTGADDPDVLILGDLNSYRMEDPIVALEEGGYVDLLEAFIGDEAYSYEFDGQLGYLDYALANAPLLDQVSGVDVWHINADELPLFDYNDDVQDASEEPYEREPSSLPLYEPTPYRSSDHDPVIVGLDLGEDQGGGGPIVIPPGDPDPTTPPAGEDSDGDGIPDDLPLEDVIDLIAEILGDDSFEDIDLTRLSILLSRLLELLAPDSSFAQADGEVLIASDVVFADALSSGTLQAGGRQLLLNAPDALEPEVLEEIQRLGATSVTILGGEVAISTAVEEALEDEGLTVDRVAGITRIETAIAAALAAGDDSRTLIARAFPGEGGDGTQAFADSLAAGGWAADDALGLLLSETDRLTTATEAHLETSTLTSATAIGGTTALADAVLTAIEARGITTDRVEGTNRFETATAIAAARGFTAESPADRVIVIEGQAADAWAAGFTSAALSAVLDAPILLVNGSDVPAETEAFLTTAFAPTADGAAVTCIADPAACDAVAAIAGLDD